MARALQLGGHERSPNCLGSALHSARACFDIARRLRFLLLADARLMRRAAI